MSAQQHKKAKRGGKRKGRASGSGVMRGMRSGFKSTVGVKQRPGGPTLGGTVLTLLAIVAVLALLFFGLG